MQPLISYWSATMSPGPSCGRKEYALPQCGHQPSDSALPSSVDRPTGRPQFQQNRFDSATTGLVINASSGSFSGTRGISTSPPPSRRVGDNARVAVVCWSCGSVSPCADGHALRVVVEVRTEHRLGGHRAQRRDDSSASMSSRLAGWVPGAASSKSSECTSAISPNTSRRWCRRRAQHGQPLAVQACSTSVAADALQRAVDEPHQPGVLQVDADAVGLLVEAGPDDVQVRVLRHQPGQDGVVGADRVDLPLLQRDQAVGPRHHRHDDRRRGDLLDPVERRGALRDAHPLAGQVRRLR